MRSCCTAEFPVRGYCWSNCRFGFRATKASKSSSALARRQFADLAVRQRQLGNGEIASALQLAEEIARAAELFGVCLGPCVRDLDAVRTVMAGIAVDRLQRLRCQLSLAA